MSVPYYVHDPICLVLTTEVETNPDQTQSLMYTVARANTIYYYSINDSGVPVKQGNYSLPFSSLFARIAYNHQSTALEVVGDLYDDTNTNHYRMTNTGVFTQVSQSLFSGVSYGSLIYVKSVGTLCIGGDDGSRNFSTQIVSQNTDWPTVRPTNHLLASIDPDLGWKFLAATTNDDTVYLVGGKDSTSLQQDTYSKYVRSLDLNGVQNLEAAQDRKWVILGTLTDYLDQGTVQYVSNRLYIIGFGSGKDLHVFDLETKQDSKYSNVYSTVKEDGVKMAGSWISNGNMTIFGGFDAADCFQQSGIIDNPGVYWGDSCDNTILEGIVVSYAGAQEVHFVNILEQN
jgi:hypothetical protein